MPDTSRLSAALADRYVIEHEIGSGGMATVYLARDLKHGREVALKVLRADLSAVLGAERFLKEISITARLDHPHILTLIDSGAADGILYYVLPLVRGESLRARIEREKQLPIEAALDIVRQVASALDYAHKQGVVHRDIKPENILLHEGEAVVADFGIALALREAGGSRLTETGLSLGTPQYMSPEQATGDRTLDARSDIYSLGAVLYEMLAGEPPVTGPTVQAVIAKLLTERPTRLRTLRDTIPDPIDAAVAKALAKVPADRFATAAEFAAALKTRGSLAAAPTRPQLSPSAWLAIAGVVVLALLGVWIMKTQLGAGRGPAVALAGKTQLTFTGNVQSPALSPDGKQLAFFSRTCVEGRCTYGVDVQDVGAAATHRIFDGATAAYGLWWSPDRRNLLMVATIGGRWGVYLLSTLGGTPRYLTSGAAAFYAGGDSLLVGPQFRSDSVFWIRVTSLDGAVADSIRVAGVGIGLGDIVVVPGTRWIAAAIAQATAGVWQVVDRRGRVADRIVNSCNCPGRASADALWLAREGAAGGYTAIRIALDARTGHLARSQDTVLTDNITGFSVTSDGSTVAYDQGTYDYGAWAVDLADALKGRFPESRRVVQASTPVSAALSPDGARLLIGRSLPAASGTLERHLSVMPFAGGPEVPLQTAGPPVAYFWRDSISVLAGTGSRGQHAALLDVRTGAVERSLELADTNVVDLTTLPDGWAWIPGTDDRIVIRRSGRDIEVKRPAWFSVLFRVIADPTGRFIAMCGWNASTLDTVGVAVVSSDGGVPVMWATHFAEGVRMGFLDDGSIGLVVLPSQESVTLYRVSAPGRLQLLGTVPRPVSNLTFSADLKRVAVETRDYHGDAWMSRVERR
jgi:hypothetical protein